MASIVFHPHGCNSTDGVVTLAQPGAAALGWCYYNDNIFPTGPAGGYEVRGMPPTVSLTIRQGPADGVLCGQEVILEAEQNGCYDLNYLSDRLWWGFCNTGIDCPSVAQKRSYPPPSLPKAMMAPATEVQIEERDVSVIEKRDVGILYHDDQGDFMVNDAGQRIPVMYISESAMLGERGEENLEERGEEKLEKGAEEMLEKRQSQTFSPPDSCILDSTTCKALTDSHALNAICIDCRQGFGNGVKVSAASSIDCRFSGGPCPVQFIDTVTVTNTFSLDMSISATIGDTGKDGGNGQATFGFGWSIAISVAHATVQGLLIPQGKIGYVQFQPQAYLGTVVTTTAKGNVCDSLGLNKICASSPGIINSSSDDRTGQYSVVLMS
ncbi:hypothetical protein BGZ63DRAFT_357699 [Mariannaea sp. PMI_226]|nr:hypothetical protein BGZ63DRAFT_357699 [Mariannaea sp. PMI_226]